MNPYEAIWATVCAFAVSYSCVEAYLDNANESNWQFYDERHTWTRDEASNSMIFPGQCLVNKFVLFTWRRVSWWNCFFLESLMAYWQSAAGQTFESLVKTALNEWKRRTASEDDGKNGRANECTGFLFGGRRPHLTLPVPKLSARATFINWRMGPAYWVNFPGTAAFGLILYS